MTEPPRIEYPCNYPIKIMGEAADGFADQVTEIVRGHAPEIGPKSVTVRDSRAGRYQSVTVTIIAYSEDQIRAIHADLKASGIVKLVL